MNKLILAMVNQFMVEHEDEILECITHPDGKLAKEWKENGDAVKEYLFTLCYKSCCYYFC